MTDNIASLLSGLGCYCTVCQLKCSLVQPAIAEPEDFSM